MPFYTFECDECEVYWEKEAPMSKPPKRSKCSLCKKQRDRVFTAPAIHFRGMDFYTNQAKLEKYKKYGMDKETADQFLKTECEYSKDRTKESAKVYKRVVPNFEKMVKEGTARRCSDKEIAKRKENARKMTADLYTKTGRDPHKDINPNLNSIY